MYMTSYNFHLPIGLFRPLSRIFLKFRLAEQLFRLISGLAELARKLGNPAEKYARKLPNPAENAASYQIFLV